MTNKNLINKYELVNVGRDSCYVEMKEKFEFKELENNYFKENQFADNITKEGFGILFIDGKKAEAEVSELRDIIWLDYKKEEDMFNTDKPFLVLYKKDKDAKFKFYGIFEIKSKDNLTITLNEFNETYHIDKPNVRVTYD